jgi:predicted metal-dependent HD superfamily phosphohydrolase
MENIKLLKEVSIWVKEHYETIDTEKLTYHHLRHTKEVVEACTELLENENLSDLEKEVLICAAWFHDVGCWNATQDLKNHEEKSVEKASEFLMSKGASPAFIQMVKDCIMATKMPQNPKNRTGKIICDADLSHFAKEGFLDKSLQLRKELKTLGLYDKKEIDWLKETFSFMESHRYYTQKARNDWEAGKVKNQNILKKEIEDREEKRAVKSTQKEMKKLRKQLPERGIETMFRLTSKNHLQLSAIADNKAHIMISVNSIIISIILTILIAKLEEYPHYLIPTILLVGTNLSAIVFAILATRPNVTQGKSSAKDIENKTANLLYFGNFHKMKYEDYQHGMRDMMNDPDYLYNSLIKDIYYLGEVLAKKYSLLRKSYNAFMYGLLLSVFAFGMASFLVF